MTHHGKGDPIGAGASARSEGLTSYLSPARENATRPGLVRGPLALSVAREWEQIGALRAADQAAREWFEEVMR